MKKRQKTLRSAAEKAAARAAERGLTLSLFIEDLRSGERIEHNAHAVHSSASIIKIPLMMAVLERIGERYSFEELVALSPENRVPFSVVTEIGEDAYTIREYLEWMMLESCNASTNVLIDLAGAGEVNRIASELGLKETVLARKMMDFKAKARGADNTASARDMARLLKTLWRGEFFRPENCRFALELMRRCRDGNLLLRYLPGRHPFAHKTGGLDEVSHDVGIFLEEEILVCALLTSEPTQEGDLRRTQLLGMLGRDLMMDKEEK